MERTTESATGVVIGAEAHIVAQQRGGPRGGIREQVEIDSYTNLVLLCPTHHRLIDEQPLIYTAAAVQEMKRLHEEQVRARMFPLGPATALDIARFQRICGDCQAVNAWQVGQSMLVVCSFGSVPRMAPSGRWRGAGLQFVQLGELDRSELLLSSSEAEPDIEYWLSDDSLHVLQHTYDPDAKAFVPLAEHRFSVARFPAGHSLEVLLQPSAGYLAAVGEIGERLLCLGADNAGAAEVLMYRLRNAGIRAPSKALAILLRFKKVPWYDGAIAKTGSTIERELKLVEAFRSAV